MFTLKYFSSLLEAASDFRFESAKACHAMVLSTMEQSKLNWSDTLELDRLHRQCVAGIIVVGTLLLQICILVLTEILHNRTATALKILFSNFIMIHIAIDMKLTSPVECGICTSAPNAGKIIKLKMSRFE